MKARPEKAGRPVPPLIAHAPVCVHENIDELRTAVRRQIMNPRLPFYQRMFIDAGYPEASNGQWSDAMIEGTVMWGDETRVTEKLQGLLSMGPTEVLVSPIAAGEDGRASANRTLRLLGRLATSGVS